MAFVILPLLVAAIFYYVAHDKAEYEDFKRLESTKKRQALLRKWVLRSFLLHGVTSIVGLALIGHLSALWIMPEAFEQLVPDIGLADSATEDKPDGFWRGVIYGIASASIPIMIFGFTAAALVRTYLAHRKNEQTKTEKPNPATTFTDTREIAALIPRNSDERFWTTLLSVNAGFSEELCFRLFLPLLFWIVTGNALLAVVLATGLFGLAHYYQGWAGVLLTMFVGLILMLVYLVTGNIWLAILIHALIDLNELAFAPWFAERLAKRTNSQNHF